MSELEKCYEMQALSPHFPYMPKEEWEGRIKRARALMDKNGIDALFLLNDLSQLYYFGYLKRAPMAFPLVGILPKEGPTTFVAEVMIIGVLQEEGYAERALGYRGDPAAPTPVAPEPVTALAELIEDMGLGEKTLGVEMGPFSWWHGMTAAEWLRLKEMLPLVKWVDSSNSVIWPQRKIKTLWEQGILRKLNNAACKGYMKAIEFARAGVNELDVFKAALQVWIDEGIVDSIYDLTAVNAARNMCVAQFRDHILMEGDSIFFDAGPRYKNYSSDCQRIIWIGDPGPKVRRWAYAAEVAHIEVEQSLKPETKLSDIWQRGHEVLVRHIGKDYWKTIRAPNGIGWVGHCVGLGINEPPYIVENATDILEPGMVINIEFPAFDIEKRLIYNMPEDTYLITDMGFECLTNGLGPKGIYIKE